MQYLPNAPSTPPPRGLPVLPVAPHKIKAVTPEFETTIVEMENGREQRFSGRELPIVGFKVSYTFLNQDESKKMWDFFCARRGAFETWALWNHHNATWYTVRFKDDKLPLNYLRQGFSSLDFEVKTCL